MKKRISLQFVLFEIEIFPYYHSSSTNASSLILMVIDASTLTVNKLWTYGICSFEHMTF